jgi:hypothetical protein
LNHGKDGRKVPAICALTQERGGITRRSNTSVAIVERGGTKGHIPAMASLTRNAPAMFQDPPNPLEMILVGEAKMEVVRILFKTTRGLVTGDPLPLPPLVQTNLQW